MAMDTSLENTVSPHKPFLLDVLLAMVSCCVNRVDLATETPERPSVLASLWASGHSAVIVSSLAGGVLGYRCVLACLAFCMGSRDQSHQIGPAVTFTC